MIAALNMRGTPASLHEDASAIVEASRNSVKGTWWRFCRMADLAISMRSCLPLSGCADNCECLTADDDASAICFREGMFSTFKLAFVYLARSLAGIIGIPYTLLVGTSAFFIVSRCGLRTRACGCRDQNTG